MQVQQSNVMAAHPAAAPVLGESAKPKSNAKLGLFAAIAILLVCMAVLLSQGSVEASGPIRNPAETASAPASSTAMVAPASIAK